MNTTPTIKTINEDTEVGVTTARLLLQLALEKEDQTKDLLEQDQAPMFLPPVGKRLPPYTGAHPPSEAPLEIEHHGQTRPEE